MIEKVNSSHPDKVADRIAGAIVDLAYSKQVTPKIAVEVLIGHGVCHIISESSCKFKKSEIKAIVNRIVGIIYELKKDCYDEIYKLQNENPPNIVKVEQDGITSFRATLQNVGRERNFSPVQQMRFTFAWTYLINWRWNNGKKENSTN